MLISGERSSWVFSNCKINILQLLIGYKKNISHVKNNNKKKRSGGEGRRGKIAHHQSTSCWPAERILKQYQKARDRKKEGERERTQKAGKSCTHIWWWLQLHATPIHAALDLVIIQFNSFASSSSPSTIASSSQSLLFTSAMALLSIRWGLFVYRYIATTKWNQLAY